jgi:hypothetical protein
METELWPNLIHASRSAGIPLYRERAFIRALGAGMICARVRRGMLLVHSQP